MAIVETDTYQREGRAVDAFVQSVNQYVLANPGKLGGHVWADWNGFVGEWGQFFNANIAKTPMLPIQLDTTIQDYQAKATQWRKVIEAEIVAAGGPAMVAPDPVTVDPKHTPDMPGLGAFAGGEAVVIGLLVVYILSRRSK